VRDPRTGGEFYRRLVRHREWELPRPGAEAVVGFLVACGVSALLHGGLMAICAWLRGTQ
jgi:hypothetical protein